MQPVDIAGAAVVGIALLRGLFLGLVREGFSLGAIAGACIAVRLFASPFGDWLEATSRGQIGPGAAPWLAGAALAVASVTAVALCGRLLQRGVRAAGFSWADRLGGALLGAAEGALVVGIAVVVLAALLGRDHSALEESHSLRALERLELVAREGGWPLPPVASPPPD